MGVKVTSEVTVVIIIVVTIVVMAVAYFVIGPPGNRKWNRKK
jgi:uncharacterized protein (UPF0333 family)